MATKSSLYEKIQKVSNEINSLEKDISVGSGSYAYKAISEASVIRAVKKAETKHGLTSIPTKQEIISSEIKEVQIGNKITLRYIDVIKVTLKIIDLQTGESIEVDSYARGIDSGDKGLGKAQTYALKYALMKAYKVATGEDPDANKSEKMVVARTPSEQVVAIRNYFSTNEKALPKMLKHFKVEKLDDLSGDQVKTIYTTYSKKGLI